MLYLHLYLNLICPPAKCRETETSSFSAFLHRALFLSPNDTVLSFQSCLYDNQYSHISMLNNREQTKVERRVRHERTDVQ